MSGTRVSGRQDNLCPALRQRESSDSLTSGTGHSLYKGCPAVPLRLPAGSVPFLTRDKGSRA